MAEVGKSRQHDKRLVTNNREAKRLAGLERHAMHENAGLAETRHDTMRQVARALRRAARKHDHVAGIERAAHGKFKCGLFVGKGAKRHRLAASLDNGSGDDGAVAVIDTARTKRPAGLDEFISGRKHGDARTADRFHRRKAAGREHADLPRADLRAPAQQGFAARNVRARIGDQLAACRRTPQFDRRRRGILDELGLLDHDHGVGAARHHAAGCDRRRGAGHDFEHGRDPAGDNFRIEREPFRRAVAGARGIGGADSETIDIGAVERRRIDRRDHVTGENAGQRRGERQNFAAERR